MESLICMNDVWPNAKLNVVWNGRAIITYQLMEIFWDWHFESINKTLMVYRLLSGSISTIRISLKSSIHNAVVYVCVHGVDDTCFV